MISYKSVFMGLDAGVNFGSYGDGVPADPKLAAAKPAVPEAPAAAAAEAVAPAPDTDPVSVAKE